MHVWIVEIWIESKKRWMPTTGAALSYDEGVIERRKWKEADPDDRFRLRRYERSR